MTTDTIIQAIEDATGVTFDEMQSRTRTDRIADARFIFSYFAYNYAELTQKQVAMFMRVTEHTVGYHLMRYQILQGQNRRFREKAKAVREKIAEIENAIYNKKHGQQ